MTTLCPGLGSRRRTHSVGFQHVLSVCLFHMGNAAPSGIVLGPGYQRLPVCEWALPLLWTPLDGDFSTCTITMPQSGEMFPIISVSPITFTHILSCLVNLVKRGASNYI